MNIWDFRFSILGCRTCRFRYRDRGLGYFGISKSSMPITTSVYWIKQMSATTGAAVGTFFGFHRFRNIKQLLYGVL